LLTEISRDEIFTMKHLKNALFISVIAEVKFQVAPTHF